MFRLPIHNQGEMSERLVMLRFYALKSNQESSDRLAALMEQITYSSSLFFKQIFSMTGRLIGLMDEPGKRPSCSLATRTSECKIHPAMVERTSPCVANDLNPNNRSTHSSQAT